MGDGWKWALGAVVGFVGIVVSAIQTTSKEIAVSKLELCETRTEGIIRDQEFRIESAVKLAQQQLTLTEITKDLQAAKEIEKGEDERLHRRIDRIRVELEKLELSVNQFQERAVLFLRGAQQSEKGAQNGGN